MALPGAIHDVITYVGYCLAAVCLAVIVGSYCIEIVGRYFFASPTRWSSSMVAYMLCAMLFLVTPELARTRGHIIISILPDRMSATSASFYMRVVYLLSCVVCLVAGWFCLQVAISQFHAGITTVNEWRIPKWYLSSLIPYALFSSGIHFMRHVVSGKTYEASGGSLS